MNYRSLIALVLTFAPVVYSVVETVLSLLIGILVIGSAIVAAMVGRPEEVLATITGMFAFGYWAPEMSTKAWFPIIVGSAALVIAVFVLRRSLARAATVVAAGIMAAAVGASRLVLGVHWPSDVVAGMALGCAVALGITMTAAIVTRLAPRPPSTEDGHARKAVHRVQGWLALERRPRPDLRAA